ncbi:protein of unknown function [Cupriavidus taiwanensis]|uniref:Uncharacterized protein n=1 Tax=Cupriavidus taiwanensis TaxID=164546 RepID=A0A7Z7NLZ0_9BURK|nr:protein of unknown function [Cupriavidus taiwanensis]SOZ02958.1 hypothetical protein CBM2597_A110022 [Cupriavidus taiwanensis]SOZ06234.1 hypothetical protein CBM2595_A80919 [Cupriavidus taiwanensis]SPC18763.1 hypothetical protein CBM2594_A80202 [Cupriavidus taiwanensis]SPD41125.1 protein of unknown function [Cupriavidus taiwanensis]
MRAFQLTLQALQIFGLNSNFAQFFLHFGQFILESLTLLSERLIFDHK